MRKLERRATICMLLAAVLVIGTLLFCVRFVRDGRDWALFYGNQGIYTDGMLSSGAIYDRDGALLAENTENGIIYNDDAGIRTATVHAVGDTRGNISTSAMSVFRSKLIGYNLLTGTYKLQGKNEDLTLTLDAEACRTAYEWLEPYDAGTVGVYDYTTGEILVMVSTPAYDPLDPPELDPDDDSGLYINRFLSSTWTPGSIFKTVTAAAAVDRLSWQDFSYYCEGTRTVEGQEITCTHAHGNVDLPGALRESCNGAFSLLAEQLDPADLEEYTERLGLTHRYDINGVKNAAGSFDFPGDPVSDGWAGVGQYNDQINPCSFMVYMGAVANGGKSAEPRLLADSDISMTGQMLDEGTAIIIRDMMLQDVAEGYGEWNFPGLPIGAKTGTAEVEGKAPNAMFAGFLTDPEHPYAFIVCIENAGGGLDNAAPIANAVLQQLVYGE